MLALVAFPNKLRRRGPSPKWQFWCKADRLKLANAQKSHLEDVLLKEWVGKMKKLFGADSEG